MTFQPMPIVKQKVVYFFVDEMCYIISCSTAVELFDEYANIFDASINSFVIESDTLIKSYSNANLSNPRQKHLKNLGSIQYSQSLG